MVQVKINNAEMKVQSKCLLGGSFIEINVPQAANGVSTFMLTYRQAEDLISAIRKEMK